MICPILAVFLAATTVAAGGRDPHVWPGTHWQTAIPEEVGMDSARLDQAREYDSLIAVMPSLDIVVARAGKSLSGSRDPHYAPIEPFLSPIALSVQDRGR